MNENRNVITSEMLDWPLEGVPEYEPPAVGGKVVNWQTGTNYGNVDFTCAFDMNGLTLRDLIHHTAVDIRSNIQNNTRPMPVPSEAKEPSAEKRAAAEVRAKARYARLREWANAKRVVFRAVDWFWRAKPQREPQTVATAVSRVAANPTAAAKAMTKEQAIAVKAAIEALLNNG